MKYSRYQSGFTLLETLMAMTLMVVAFTSILLIQSRSVQSSIRARQMNTVTMLAKTKMIEVEESIQGKTFSEVKKDDGGTFKEPHQQYRWTLEIKEVEFPSFAPGGDSSGGGDDANNESMETMMKLVTKFLSDAVREVKLTLIWSVKGGERKYTITTYWVDLNHEFSLSL